MLHEQRYAAVARHDVINYPFQALEDHRAMPGDTAARLIDEHLASILSGRIKYAAQ